MKAHVLHGIQDLRYEEVEEPKLKHEEALVEVMAAGICGSDIPRIFINGTYHFPTIPGHEFAGRVCKVFDGGDAEWLNKRVGVFPLVPCMKCTPCRQQQYEMCRHYDYLGSRSNGGFAEYVAVPIRNLIELPEEISWEAAAMLEPASVGIHALQRLNLKDISTAAIFGPGTIGMLIAQWLRTIGVPKIYLIGTNIGQKNLAEQLGFSEFINCKKYDAVQEILNITDGEGTDIVIEGTGHNDVLEACLEVVKRGGDVLLVGNPHGDVSLGRDAYWKILRKQLCLVGTWNSSFVPEREFDDWTKTLDAMRQGLLQPERQITHRLKLDELQHGLQIMKEKNEYYNKIMIVR